ncbi:aspartic peptidase domain-containing protein [Suillus spraguei]|nr:aspartic peptidase domain-containing protein [Suillus spraguei]
MNLDFSNGTNNLSQHDKARVAALRNYNTHGQRARPIDVWSTIFDYTMSVGIGRPPTTYKLILDTGSSNTWVGGDREYLETNDSFDTEDPVRVVYGSENDDEETSFDGTIFRDTVTLGDGLTVTEFPLGVAYFSEGFDDGEDGVLGIGPRALTRQTLTDRLDDTIPTITDCLYDQHKISRHVVGIFLRPITADRGTQWGEVTFGGIDHDSDTTNNPASSDYWGIDLRITYGDTEISEILGNTAGVVDSGISLIKIASDAYEKYQDKTGGIVDGATGLLRISRDQYDDLEDLNFHFGNRVFVLTRDAQIWPRSLNTRLDGGRTHIIYLVIKNIGTESGGGHDFVLGATFIQRFYVMLDRTRSCIGFAKTDYTYAITNYST